uniref:Taste receptor type 2 n=1 Tax=Leptobrachium leishanense TaxID=445787 RepID=A0A8C5QFX9_9ANUR
NVSTRADASHYPLCLHTRWKLLDSHCVRDMISPENIIILVVIFLVSLMGFIFNTAILSINYKRWKSGGRLLPSDQIHIFIGVANILLQCFMAAQSVILAAFNHLLYVEEVIVTFFVLASFLIYVCVWLNTWLCVYYVVSIASFTCQFFVWLKGNLSNILLKLMLVSVVGSFFVSFKSINVNTFFQLLSLYLGCFIPFGLSNICLGHTLFSILRHVWRIKHRDSDLSFSPNLQAHVRAAKTMTLLILLYISYCLGQVFGMLYKYYVDKVSVFSWFLLLFFPSADSFIIIQSNTKLRKAFQRWIGAGGGCCEHSGKSDIERNG